MKKPIFTLCLLAAGSLAASAQWLQMLPTKSFPEHTQSKQYTVEGYRHGPSFFPKVKMTDHVEYDTAAPLSFKKYHSADVIYRYMETFAKQYPDLVEVYQVGESYEGRPIIQMTLTNKKTGKPTDKPAAYFEGNRHSGEVSSAESVLWLMNHLLTNYGKDSEITNILDKNAIYLRPINNPDGHNLYMHTAQSNRSTVRPYDNDGDGLLDEDPAEDLNGDGYITQIRYKADKGDYIIDPADPSGRLMKRVEPGKGDYKVISEGIDNDGDGRINEDGIGGLDLHRNYPENWRPMEEATGRGFTQSGAGEYPLSENETRATFSFLIANPNIYVVNSMDTRVPMHLRAPSTSASEERMYPEDLAYYKTFDAIGKSITGYERAGDAYQDYGGGSPLFGHGPDFGYWYFGAVWYGDEIWDGGKVTEDYNGDGKIDDLDKLWFDDKNNNGLGFLKWEKFNHPTLGEVEIGGWNPKFFSQNSPSNQIEKWASNQALFNLAMIKYLPELAWGEVTIKKAKAAKDSKTVDYTVTVNYANKGKLPTAFRQADLVKIVTADMITLGFDEKLISGTEPTIKVLNKEGKAVRGNKGSFSQGNGHTAGNSSNACVFTVKVDKNHTQPITFNVGVKSTRAGVLADKTATLQQ